MKNIGQTAKVPNPRIDSFILNRFMSVTSDLFYQKHAGLQIGFTIFIVARNFIVCDAL